MRTHKMSTVGLFSENIIRNIKTSTINYHSLSSSKHANVSVNDFKHL